MHPHHQVEHTHPNRLAGLLRPGRDRGTGLQSRREMTGKQRRVNCGRGNPTRHSCYPHTELLETRCPFRNHLSMSHNFPTPRPHSQLPITESNDFNSSRGTPGSGQGSSAGPLEVRALGGHWQHSRWTWGLLDAPACCAIAPAIHRCSEAFGRNCLHQSRLLSMPGSYSPYLEAIQTPFLKQS